MVDSRIAGIGDRLLPEPRLRPPLAADAHNADRADELAAKLRATIGEVARVSRPELCAEIRISGLGDAATSQAVAAQVAKLGGCPPEGVKVGAINRLPGRQGTVWVKYPVLAAKKIVDAGRFTVGWSTVRATLLEARPQRC